MTIQSSEIAKLRELEIQSGGNPERRIQIISNYITQNPEGVKNASLEMRIALLTGLGASYGPMEGNTRARMQSILARPANFIYQTLQEFATPKEEVALLQQNPQTLVSFDKRFEEVAGRLTIGNAPQELNQFGQLVGRVMGFEVPSFSVQVLDRAAGDFYGPKNRIRLSAHYFDSHGKFINNAENRKEVVGTLIHELGHSYDWHKYIRPNWTAPSLYSMYVDNNSNNDPANLTRGAALSHLLVASNLVYLDQRSDLKEYYLNPGEWRAEYIGKLWPTMVADAGVKLAQTANTNPALPEKKEEIKPAETKVEPPKKEEVKIAETKVEPPKKEAQKTPPASGPDIDDVMLTKIARQLNGLTSGKWLGNEYKRDYSRFEASWEALKSLDGKFSGNKGGVARSIANVMEDYKKRGASLTDPKNPLNLPETDKASNINEIKSFLTELSKTPDGKMYIAELRGFAEGLDPSVSGFKRDPNEMAKIVQVMQGKKPDAEHLGTKSAGLNGGENVSQAARAVQGIPDPMIAAAGLAASNPGANHTFASSGPGV